MDKEKTTTRTGIYIGRFQAPDAIHDGHIACINKILETNDVCIVMVRDTLKDERNPLTLADRFYKIRDKFPDERRVVLMGIPDPGCNLGVYFGREVGYDIEQLQFDKEIESISGTKLRRKAKKK